MTALLVSVNSDPATIIEVEVSAPQIIEVSTNGVQGLSAYQVAVANGYPGTETEWLASLQGSGSGGATDWITTDW